MSIGSNHNVAEQHSVTIRSHLNGLEETLAVSAVETNTSVRANISDIVMISNFTAAQIDSALEMDMNNIVQIGEYFREADELAKLSMINT